MLNQQPQEYVSYNSSQFCGCIRFLRVPGGCYVEGGDWLKDRFQWKNALGSTRNRPGHLNAIWGYWSTDGVVLKFNNPLMTHDDQ